MIAPWGWIAEWREALGIRRTTTTERAWGQLREHIVGLKTELDSGQRVGIARELAEIVYACYDAAAMHSIYLDEAIEEVHRANMDLVPIQWDEDKIRQPRGWKPPTMTRAVAPREQRPPRA